jgi:hypothetical protein
MPTARRLFLHASVAFALAFSPPAKAQDALVPGPKPLLPHPAVYQPTLGDATQRALATSQGLGLANLGIQDQREATAAARTDDLPPSSGTAPSSPSRSPSSSPS